MSESIVKIKYTNYKGQTAWRRILPTKILFTSTNWHKQNQWILEAFDYDKEEMRQFAVQDIERWLPLDRSK